jgi:RNA polymerase sigma factor (sigma-70 family)
MPTRAEIAEMERAARRLAARTSRQCRRIEFDDLHGEALLGLAQAIHRYDPQRGCFYRFAMLHMRSALAEAVRERGKRRKAVRFVPLSPLLVDEAPGPEALAEQGDTLRRLRACLARIQPGGGGRVFWTAFSEGLSAREAGARLGFSPAYAAKAYQRTTQALRKVWGSAG